MKKTVLLSAGILVIAAIIALTYGSVFAAGNMEMTHSQAIQRLLDYMEIQNVMAKHSYYYGAQEQWKELDEAWSRKRDDISYGHNDGYYVGRKSVEAYYGKTNENRRKQTLEAVSKIYPEIKNIKENEGVGDLVMHTLTTPYIEIAEDGQARTGRPAPCGYGRNSPRILSRKTANGRSGISRYIRMSWAMWTRPC
jgi:hypothetical protein